MSCCHRNKIGAVNYSIGANIATNKNKITNLGGSDNIIQTMNGELTTLSESPRFSEKPIASRVRASICFTLQKL